MHSPVNRMRHLEGPIYCVYFECVAEGIFKGNFAKNINIIKNHKNATAATIIIKAMITLESRRRI